MLPTQWLLFYIYSKRSQPLGFLGSRKFVRDFFASYFFAPVPVYNIYYLKLMITSHLNLLILVIPIVILQIVLSPGTGIIIRTCQLWWLDHPKLIELFIFFLLQFASDETFLWPWTKVSVVGVGLNAEVNNSPANLHCLVKAWDQSGSVFY